MPEAIEAVAIIFLTLVFSFLAYRKKSLDEEGAIIASIFGIAVYWFGGLSSFIAILLFFIFGDFFTRYGRSKKGKTHEKRSTGNILGNAGSGLIALILGSPIAFFGAISAALADTLSSEIGMLSKEKAVLITNWKKTVPSGTDGGVTILGVQAAIFGAGIMGFYYYLVSGSIYGATIIVFAGVLGSIIDSPFGSVFERKKMLNNAEVNFFGSGAGALCAFLLFSLI